MADPAELLEAIWQSLTEATTAPGNGFTLMNVATTGLAGGPRARFVIMRDFWRSPERIGFATHAQSEKIVEIRANPAVAVTCYDRQSSVQLRAEGVATVIEDDAERWRAWQRLAPHSRQQYVSQLVPGESFETHKSLSDDPSTAYQRFAWISLELRRLDWLELSTDPIIASNLHGRAIGGVASASFRNHLFLESLDNARCSKTGGSNQRNAHSK